MVQFNFAERTIKAKVVYYGPAQSGKTTSLEQIHRITDPGGANRLISLNTAQDRTLFFDLLPFSLGAVAGYDFKIQLYTVPGQVQYNATRRVVLAGADAVVFVADARRSAIKENQAAFENMKVNLLANRLVPEKVPLVVQYNKQDLPDLMPSAELDKALNPWNRPAFPTVAADGKGIMEAFTEVVKEMLASIAVKYNLREKGLDPQDVPAIVAQAFAAVMKQAEVEAPPAATPAAPAKVVVSQPTDTLHAAAPPSAAGEAAGLVSEELLHRSIRSNVELAEALAGLSREMTLGLGSILSHAELLLIYREDAREKRAAAIRAIQGEAARLRTLVQGLGRPAAEGSTPTPVAPSASAAAPPSATGAGFEGVLRQVVRAAQGALDGRGVSVEVSVPPDTQPPRCPPQDLERALVHLLQGIATAAPPRTAVSVRCERKPVLFKGREGETRRDFLMLSIAQAGSIPAEDQNRLLQADPSAMGGAAALVREMGGFVRFAPLPEGGLETRVFLPAA
jgi:signal recognition particle receptor subunit beta